LAAVFVIEHQAKSPAAPASKKKQRQVCAKVPHSLWKPGIPPIQTWLFRDRPRLRPTICCRRAGRRLRGRNGRRAGPVSARDRARSAVRVPNQPGGRPWNTASML
jgi:hypothetical protein